MHSPLVSPDEAQHRRIELLRAGEKTIEAGLGRGEAAERRLKERDIVLNPWDDARDLAELIRDSRSILEAC